jgi:hypothetical protein
MTELVEVGSDAKAVAEWFMANHTGEVCGLHSDALIDGLARVLADFRGHSQPAGLTERQAEALKFVSAYHTANGFAPTYREIAKRFGCSTSRAHELVSALVDRGCLVRLPGRARSVALAGRA